MKNIQYINAGAGSGKTTRLTQILSEQLSSGRYKPSEVILTTFTELAASEFREKAREALFTSGHADAAAELDSAAIGTVHAVALSFIQKYWYLIGVSPDMKVMSDDDLQVYISESLGNYVNTGDLEFFRSYQRFFDLKDGSHADLNFWKDHLLSIIDKVNNYNVDIERSKADSCRVVEQVFNSNTALDHELLKLFADEFVDLIPEDRDNQEFNLVIWEMFCHELSFEGTGVIFAGFDIGHDFPSFFEINIHCNNHGEIVYEDVDSKVNCQNPYLKVFAINEEAYTFITGVNSNFEEDLKKYIDDSNELIIKDIRNLLEKENIDDIDKIIVICQTVINGRYSDLTEYFDDFRLDTLEYTSFAIEYLPHWLLCDLADYLIQLTALKQKISSEIESVSMDADVTLMTKYDGLKWVKYNYEMV